MDQEAGSPYFTYLCDFQEQMGERLIAFFRARGVVSGDDEDLASEVYFRAAELISGGKLRLHSPSFTDFAKYLWGIARHVRAGHFKRINKGAPFSCPGLEDLPAPAFADRELLCRLAGFPAALLEAVESLPGAQRHVAYLYFVEGEGGRLTRSDISRITGIREDTVSRYLTRARSRLSRELSSYKDCLEGQQS